jgi:hypothetical protein
MTNHRCPVRERAEATATGISTGAPGRIERGARLGLASLVAGCAALAAAGCDSTPPQPMTAPTAAASGALSAGESRQAMNAQAKALDAYQSYLLAYAAASQAGNPDDPTLATYLADPLLSLTRHTIRTLKDNGEVQLGAQTATILSSQTDLAATAPTVTIHACLDYSNLRLVYATSRSPVPDSALANTRMPAVVTVARYPSGQWLVTSTKQGRGTC